MISWSVGSSIGGEGAGALLSLCGCIALVRGRNAGWRGVR